MAAPSFQTGTFAQVSFETDNDKLSHILAAIANLAPYTKKDKVAVNLRAYTASKNKITGVVSVNLVPGVGFGVAFPGTQTNKEVSGVTDRLLDLDVEYSVKKVVIANLPSAPGQLARAQRLLTCNGVSIENSYIDESLGQVYDTSDLNLTTKILTNAKKLDDGQKVDSLVSCVLEAL